MSDVAVAETQNITRRKVEPKAKESDLSMMVDGHKCIPVEFWLRDDHTLEDALKPEFWSQVAHRFRRTIAAEGNYAGSIIELRRPDHSFYARLYIRAVREKGLVVHLLESHDIGQKRVKSDKYRTQWIPGSKPPGFRIIRNSDAEIVGREENFPTRELAQKWIDEAG